MAKYSEQVRKALSEVLSDWLVSSPRWSKIKEKLNFAIELESPINCAANFNWRKFPMKYQAAELIWYMLMWRENDFIKRFSQIWWNIWIEWLVNSNYWFLVFQEKSANNWYMSQFDWAVYSLLKDKDSRQAVIHYNVPRHQHEWVKDFACTMYNQFIIRDNKLIWMSYMRSNDAFFWMTFDAVWFSLVQQSLYLELKKTYEDLELGQLYYNASSFHIYENFFETAEQVSKSEAIEDFEFKLTVPLSEFANLSFKERSDIISAFEQLASEGRKTTQEEYAAFITTYFKIHIRKI